jgi:hypothetical protein
VLETLLDGQAHDIAVAHARLFGQRSNAFLHLFRNAQRHDNLARVLEFFAHDSYVYKDSIHLSTEKVAIFFRACDNRTVKRTPIDFSKPIPVRLPPELLRRVEALAKRLGEPRSTIMRMALRIGIESLEKAVLVEPSKGLASVVYSSGSIPPDQFNEEKPKKRGG